MRSLWSKARSNTLTEVESLSKEDLQVPHVSPNPRFLATIKPDKSSRKLHNTTTVNKAPGKLSVRLPSPGPTFDSSDY